MIKLKRVAALTDFSEAAERGVRYAAGLARKYSSDLILVHTYPLPMPPAVSPEVIVGYDTAALLEVNKQLAEKRMTDALLAPFLEGIRTRGVLREGSVSEAMEEIENADLIVIGTAGVSGFKKALMGSNAETVFRSAKGPVLTVGPHSSCKNPQPLNLGTIILAMDCPSSADVALPYAFSLANDHHAKPILLHVEPEAEAPFSFDKAMMEARRLNDLHAMILPNANLWCEPEYRVAFGDTAPVIIEEAARAQADLIIMGVRGKSRLAAATSHFAGGTVYRVAAGATCPVLTVRGSVQ